MSEKSLCEGCSLLAHDMQKNEMDKLDYKILEAVIDDGRITYKELAKKIHTDERLISRRMDKLQEKGIVKFTAEIDWNKLGFNTIAYIGTRTGIGETLRQKLFDTFKNEPRIVRVDSTVGSNEYVVHAIGRNLQDFRSNISIPLEPITSGLSTSIITDRIKVADFKGLLKLAEKENLSEDGRK